MSNNGPRNRLAVILSAAVLILASAGYSQTFTAFDGPGAIRTFVTGISSQGRILGYTIGGLHGFIRETDGTFTLFDVTCPPLRCPGPMPSRPSAINSRGQVAGVFYSPTGVFSYIRSHEGAFTIVGAPNSLNTFARDINSAGQVVGQYADATTTHSFLREPDGTFISFDPPGVGGSYAVAINSEGRVAGNYFYQGEFRVFIRRPNGDFITFDAPNTNYLTAVGIDSEGNVAGGYNDQAGTLHGFLRREDGTFTTIDGPNATRTVITAMSPEGQIAGQYFDATGAHAFLWQPDRGITSFDAPAGTGTLYPTAINSSGVIAGDVFVFGSIFSHGFVRTCGPEDQCDQ